MPSDSALGRWDKDGITEAEAPHASPGWRPTERRRRLSSARLVAGEGRSVRPFIEEFEFNLPMLA